jgi:ATP/maltotriose-dependent transcriptional regulator MalT
MSLAEEADAHGRTELLLDLADALVAAGDLVAAANLTVDAAELAGSSGERALELRARCERDLIRGVTDPEFTADAQIQAGEQALRALAELEDDAGQAAAWRLIASGENMRADWDRMAQALEHALPHARRAGDRRREHEVLRELALSVYWGSTPVAEALPRCEQMLEQSGDSGQLRAVLLACLGGLHGMEGRLEKGRTLLDEAEAIHRALGSDLFAASIGFMRGPLELAAGDPAAAEAVLRSNCEALQRMGETGWLSTLAAYLAQAIYEQGRLDEAEGWVKTAREVGAVDDTTTQVLWRQSQALICARRGEHGEADRLGREALAMIDRTDQWNERAHARMTRAEVSRLAGSVDGAADAAAKAQELFKRKGNSVMVERARAFLEALQPA